MVIGSNVSLAHEILETVCGHIGSSLYGDEYLGCKMIAQGGTALWMHTATK